MSKLEIKFAAKIASRVNWPFYMKLLISVSTLDELQGSAVSLTRTGAFNRTACSDTTGSVCANAVDGLADSQPAHQWQTHGHHNPGQWLHIHFNKIYRVNKIRLKQLEIAYKQIKDLKIDFNPSSTVRVQCCFILDSSISSKLFSLEDQ